ncbi:MAG: toprim domain-containing protein [Acidimicrobiales bacterium]
MSSALLGPAREGYVATCTAPTEDHVKLLRRFARRVVLAFDADAAGQNAAARFYEWEKKHDSM